MYNAVCYNLLSALTFTTLLAYSADDKLVIFFLFFPEKLELIFLDPFSGKNKKKYFNMLSAENFTHRVLSMKS